MSFVPTSAGGAAAVGSPYISNWPSAAIQIPATSFGAKFDNSTNDTAAIQAALDAAASFNPYGASNANDRPAIIVQLPPGRAKVTTLNMSANTILQGHGPAATYLVSLSNVANTPILQLKTGAEVQCGVRDLGIILNDQTINGINFIQSGGASITGDTLHQLENLVIVGGRQAIWLNNSTECRIDNVYIGRASGQNVSGGGAMLIGGSDHMISRVTIAGLVITDSSNDGFGLHASNCRITDLKVFGSSGGSTFGAGIHVVGQRNQFTEIEVQDFAGRCFEDDQGNNVYDGCVFDSCQSGCYPFGGVVMRNALFVNRGGGAFTMPFAFDTIGTSDVEAQLVGVANVFNGGANVAVGSRVKITGAGSPSAEYPSKTSGALSTVALSSGVGAQVNPNRDATLVINTTTAAGSIVVALSPDNVTYSNVVAKTVAATDSVTVAVPCGWYVKATVVTATIGTCTYY